jgi:tRNA A37 threonylcarbamoyladenosine dehydratase
MAAPNYYMNIYVSIIGLSGAGGFFAKEFARYAASLKDKETVFKLLLFDPEDVEQEDITKSVFLPQDVGWNRAAVLSGALRKAYPSITCIKGIARNFSEFETSSVKRLFSDNYYELENDIYFLFDFTCVKKQERAVKKFWEGCKSCVTALYRRNSISVASKISSLVIANFDKVPVGKSRDSLSKMLCVSRICLAFMVQFLSGGNISFDDIYFDGRFGVSLGRRPAEVLDTAITFAKKTDSWLIVCVGAGGTGGNFTKELPHIMLGNENVSLLIIDGDRVEEKNLKRQPYGEQDIQQNKADILCADLKTDYPMLSERIFSYPRYLDTAGDLSEAVMSCGENYDHVLLVGGVDNHAARRVMESFHNLCDSSVYIDAANEWSEGQTIISVRMDGKEISPVRSFYYPDVLTDASPSASERSCGAINESSPQHICTNLCSAQMILSVVEPLIMDGKVHGGIVYFDTFSQFSRFQPLKAEDMV